MRRAPRTVGGVTRSQASWKSGGSWGSFLSRCSAGTLGVKGLCLLRVSLFNLGPASPPLPSAGLSLGLALRGGDGGLYLPQP